ncbi:MAG: hypothetical protein Q9217_001826 [Psora testacea]
MPKLSTPKSRASNISSAANPTASTTTSTIIKSSILKSSFAPSNFQQPLFASVIQGFDSQHLRIHDTNTGRLRCDHAIGSSASITCLDWGYSGQTHPNSGHQEASKKRKRIERINGEVGSRHARNVTLAFGTTDSEIHLYSPAEAKTVGLLREGHAQGIRSFRFVDDGVGDEGWSVGGDARLVQWDLKTSRPIRTISLPNGSANTIQPLGSSLIYASHLAYLLDIKSQTSPATFNASTNSVRTIVSAPFRSARGVMFLTAAEADRFINVFHIESPTLIGSLRTENEILQVEFYTQSQRLDKSKAGHELAGRQMRPQEALAIINSDGVLELFPEPFEFGTSESRKSLESTKERIKARTRRSAAQLRIVRPDKTSAVVPLVNASFQGSNLILAWVEGGIDVVFDTVQWRDEGTEALLLKDNVEIAKGKSSGLRAVAMNGIKDMGKTRVDESHTVVTNGLGSDAFAMEDQQPEVIDISSGQEDSESEEEDVGRLQSTNDATVQGQNVTQNVTEDHTKDIGLPKDEEDGKEEPTEPDEPSFGDILRAHAGEAVDVQASYVDPNAQSLVPTADKSLQQPPSGMSLGAVLTQSLRTNDKTLLETCFHTKDIRLVRATIERLDSSFAATLLQRLAERLHSRPGRAGSLMVWIQWTLIAHGGYLAGQPEVMKKLASLHRVVKERANSLQSLLSLKGKLDMLEAQMNLRKNMQGRSRVHEEEDEEGVIYVEGQEESDSEQGEEEAGENDEETHIAQAHAGAQATDMRSMMNAREHGDEEVESGSESRRMVNGNLADSEDEGSESDEEGMFDEEASSTDQDSGEEFSEEEIDHDDVDTESSDADTSPPPKRQANSSISDRKRR